jgi:hypothetical protein
MTKITLEFWNCLTDIVRQNMVLEREKEFTFPEVKVGMRMLLFKAVICNYLTVAESLVFGVVYNSHFNL